MRLLLGVESIRESASGGPLPSARSLSEDTTRDISSVYEEYTLFIMQWGQFLDHDITHTPISKGIVPHKLLRHFTSHTHQHTSLYRFAYSVASHLPHRSYLASYTLLPNFNLDKLLHHTLFCLMNFAYTICHRRRNKYHILLPITNTDRPF